MLWRRNARWFALPALIMTLVLVVTACGDGGNGDENGSDNGSGGGSETGGTQLEIDRPIVFADYGWDSAVVLNRIAQFILEEGYGAETEATPGETIPLFQGQIDGDIDVSMEIWVDQNPPYEPAREAGDVVELGNSVDDTVQGWWVPTYVIEGDEERGIEPMAPDLKSIEDLPEYTDLFQDPEDPSKGRLHGGIPGWEAERINAKKFEYYGLGEHYNRFLPGSGAALDTSLLTAFEAGEPWLGYTWTPTWVAGQVDITLLEEPEYSDECWAEIEASIEENRPTEDACAWPVTNAVIAANADFAEEAPVVVEFLEKFNTNESHISATLAHMAENEVERDEAAVWFLNEYQDLWTEWVPEDVAERVQAALDEQ